ncbi:Hsp33 family molecular chaperone HslO [Fibrobacter sp.]|uniref:Hsp33 family molecular chaperone HslO n=1 Tax=Fibrobacter sp. TaxID=35828 RepID=UPI00388D6FCD
MNFKDRIIRATGKKTPFRMIVADMTATMNEIGKQHNAKGFALKLLAENTIASLFLSSGLKYAGTVTFTTSFAGEITKITSDSTPMGLVRAMIPQDELLTVGANEPAIVPQNISVIKLNERGKRVHESIIEAPSISMGQNLATYLLQSEQVRSAVGIEAQFNKEDPSKLDYAAGFYIEAFPDLEEKDINLLEVIVQNLPKFHELLKPEGYDLDELLDQLRGPYDLDIVRELDPKAYCPCSKERTLATLASLKTEDLKDLRKDGKDLEVTCDFCRKKYTITMQDLDDLIKERK